MAIPKPSIERNVAASRARERRAIREALERNGECEQVVMLSPPLARLLFGFDPEPGTKFLGVHMEVTDELEGYAWRVQPKS